MRKKLKETILAKYRNFAHFGDAIGMARQQVHRYVNDQNKPRSSVIERFADGLGIDKTECEKLFNMPGDSVCKRSTPTDRPA